VCQSQGCQLDEVRFYTGVPGRDDDPFWHHFWTNKLARLGRRGGTVYSRSLEYRMKIASAVPVSPVTQNRKGINYTDWIRIDRATYDACLDPRDYWPKTRSTTGGVP